jgi:hypothetical protein
VAGKGFAYISKHDDGVRVNSNDQTKKHALPDCYCTRLKNSSKSLLKLIFKNKIFLSAQDIQREQKAPIYMRQFLSVYKARRHLLYSRGIPANGESSACRVWHPTAAV